jgi:hypothetical protein
MQISNPLGGIDFEWGHRVVLSPWLNQTIVYSVLVGYEAAPGYEYPCATDQRGVGTYHAPDKSLEQFCLDTPFLSIGDSFGPLQCAPYATNQVFAANRYLLNLQSHNLQDITSTFPTQVSPGDVSTWVAHDYTWWDSARHLPVAQARTEVQQNNNVLEQVIQMCPILAGNCVTLVNVESYVHGFVDDLIISPGGQQILWSVVVFPLDAQIQAGSPSGLIQNILAFQTSVSTGETIQIFDLHDYETQGVVGHYAHWSPDSRLLVVSLDVPSDTLGLFALFVRFEPVIQTARSNGRHNSE